MPFSYPSDARDAIASHFTDAWNAQAAPVPELRYQDKYYTGLPAGTATWARLTIIHNLGQQVTLGAVGNRRFRRFGIVTVQIFTPAGDGLTRADAMVKIAMDALEGATTDGGDTVDFRRARFNEVGEDGPWHQTNVTAEFEYDAVR